MDFLTTEQMEEKIGRKIGYSEKQIITIPVSSDNVVEYVRIEMWVVGNTYHRSFLNPNLQ